MPGLSTEIVEHQLPMRLECPSVQQKLKRVKPEMLLKIKKKVRKQFDAGFLEVAKYPKWVANIVPIPKKDGKVRMYVDYRDLHRASPKDNFPLSHIDTLVENTTKNSLFFFSWIVSLDTVKFGWLLKIMRRVPSSLYGEILLQSNALRFKNAGATY